MQYYAYVYRDGSIPIYVGKGQGRRAYHHLKRTDHHPLVYKLRKMEHAPHIDIIPAIDENHALFLEECLIEIFGRKDLGKGTLLNMTNGGEPNNGYIPTEAHRKRMSEVMAGRKLSEATIAKLKIAKRDISDDTRRKMSTAQSHRSPETREAMRQASIGRVWTSEMRAKMSETKRARMTDETRARISSAKQNLSAETRERMSAAQTARRERDRHANSL